MRFTRPLHNDPAVDAARRAALKGMSWRSKRLQRAIWAATDAL